MSAYAPTSIESVALVAALLIALLVLGHATGIAAGRAAIASAWALAVLGPLVAHALTADEPAGFRMLALIGAGLLGMKAVVVTAERTRGMRAPRPSEWLAFATWVGMRPRLFVGRTKRAPLAHTDLLRRGVTRLLQGAVLVAVAALVWRTTHAGAVATALLLVGLSLAVHFGACTLLAAAWRRRGVPCRAVFVAPLRSESLGEFWSRRWNLAFSEMTSAAVYRPLVTRTGSAVALAASFALSGVLHEMAISAPVRAGFGGPLAYFLLHGALVGSERAAEKRGMTIGGIPGRIWTAVWLVLPLPLLFHPAFIEQVVWPLAGITAWR